MILVEKVQILMIFISLGSQKSDHIQFFFEFLELFF